ncbi:glycosyltransferase [Tateyamaria sp. ANG-S1]|uniref:glycosyltransferase n=1 Tax=Tateyamaria sp. ANG-S1 TaxID=1577905 RepID=UPI00057F5657|nr:glycosyltransferase [Tateyamaria sp. ANG-S1]KIC45455.1 glycosyl transferase family 1 [Tateyamaria sp. ANG-S1]
MKPRPIAYLTGEYPRATDTFIQREVAQLRHLGFEIHTCSVRSTDPSHHVGPEQQAEHASTFVVQQSAKRPFRLIAAHARMMRFPRQWLGAAGLAWSTSPKGVKSRLWQLFYFLQAGVLADHMLRIGVQHLHNHFGNSSCSVAMLAAHMAKVPFSYTAHGPMEFFEPHHWRLDAKIARASFVAAISHFARAQCMLFSDKSHWSKIKIVHCGVEPELYEKHDHEPGKHLVFVGRLAAIKGVPLLLDALVKLKSMHADVRLTLIGDGPERQELERRADTLGLSEAVTFTGYLGQNDVAATLKTADILVLPSFAEGVPVVLMEAMATGLPVIASRVAGVQELVEDGASGYVLPPGDVNALQVAIDKLLTDETERVNMGHVGRTKVIADFDIAREAAWLGHLFACSLNGHLPDALRPDNAHA